MRLLRLDRVDATYGIKIEYVGDVTVIVTHPNIPLPCPTLAYTPPWLDVPAVIAWRTPSTKRRWCLYFTSLPVCSAPGSQSFPKRTHKSDSMTYVISAFRLTLPHRGLAHIPATIQRKEREQPFPPSLPAIRCKACFSTRPTFSSLVHPANDVGDIEQVHITGNT